MPTLLQRPGFAGALARFWQRSYFSDYVGILFLLILNGLIQTYAVPFHRVFRIDSIPLSYPYAQIERVSVGWLFIFALGIPIVIFTIWAVTTRPGLHKVHVTYLGLVTSILLTVFVTDVMKNAIGRPRPDFMKRCNPHIDTPRNKMVTYSICDNPDGHIVHDGFRSFPSGHSSFAFAGLGYLFLFLAGQFYVFHPPTSLLTMMMTFSPLLGAFLIAVSRWEDYRHDVYDILSGSLLGLLIAWTIYRRFYPALQSKYCDTPYPSKGELMMAAANYYQRKERDEEARIGGRRGANGNVGGGSGTGSGPDSEDDVNRSFLRPPSRTNKRDP